MIPFVVESRRCDRAHAHRRHRFVPDPKSVTEFACPGRTTAARSLAELLARRPDLADVTSVAVINRLAVAAA